MREKNRGFLMVEMVIIIIVILIILAIAIPGLLRARLSANEGAASATLRSLASAQTSFLKSASVDQDNDGSGEYGVFNELTGATTLRGCGNPELGQPKQRPALSVTDLSVALRSTSGNFATKSGYNFQIFLPGESKVITDNGTDPLEPLNSSIASHDATIQQQENRFICYSWPVTYRSSGVRAFVVDQSAEVYASANTSSGNQGFWQGDMSRPDYNSAMSTENRKPDETNWENIGAKTRDVVDPNHIWLPTY